MSTWNYSGDPTSSPRDEVRFLIGDTESDDPQLLDREVEYALHKYSNAVMAAAFCATMLANKYARLCDRTTGDLTISHAQRQEHYRTMATALRQQAGVDSAGVCAPYAGGISVTDKQANTEDTDVVQPTFTKGMMDYASPVGPTSSEE
jgi:hypothetical protein